MSRKRKNLEEDLELIRATLRRKNVGEKQYPEFRKFLAKYESKMFGFTFRKLNHNQSLVEDVMQDAKCKFFSSGIKETYQHSPSAYYWRVLKTCILDAVEKRDKNQHDSLDQKRPDGSCSSRKIADSSHQTDNLVDKKRRSKAIRRVLHEALQRLSKASAAQYQATELLAKRYIEGESVKNIAAQRNLKPNTVTQHLRRGLIQLKKIIDGMKYEGFPGVDLVFEAIEGN